MPKSLPARITSIIVTGAMAVSAFAPSAYAFYRCRMMGTTHRSACCGAPAGEPSARQTPALQGQRCCTRHDVALERSPTEITPSASGPSLSALPAVAVLPAVSPVSPLVAPRAWTRARFDSGPGILLRTCSLLI